MPKLSVIVPVYNVEKFLPRCLNSILSQTLSDIEIICVDDCSPDKSIDILQDYEKRDSRIKVLRHSKNKRQGGARNTGITIATGDYIGFIDSDDWIEPDYYEKLYNAAIKADADVAITGILKHRKHISKTIVSYSTQNIFETVEDKFKACKCPPDFHPVNKIYRRDMLLNNNICFAENIMFEDIDFVAKCIFFSNRIVTVPGTFYRYVYNGESTVKGKETPKKQADRYTTRKNFIEFARVHNIPVPDSYKNIPVKMYQIAGVPILKLKEKNGIRAWRLFDFIPVWRTKA